MLCATIHSLVLAMAVAGQAPADNAFPPHRVIGNVYYVVSNDVGATVYRALGIPAEAEVRDRLDRPAQLNRGELIKPLFTGATG